MGELLCFIVSLIPSLEVNVVGWLPFTLSVCRVISVVFVLKFDAFENDLRSFYHPQCFIYGRPHRRLIGFTSGVFKVSPCLVYASLHRGLGCEREIYVFHVHLMLEMGRRIFFSF
ncbi:hypothetical protein Dimus_002965 [Dionaea muscipula]